MKFLASGKIKKEKKIDVIFYASIGGSTGVSIVPS